MIHRLIGIGPYSTWVVPGSRVFLHGSGLCLVRHGTTRHVRLITNPTLSVSLFLSLSLPLSPWTRILKTEKPPKNALIVLKSTPANSHPLATKPSNSNFHVSAIWRGTNTYSGISFVRTWKHHCPLYRVLPNARLGSATVKLVFIYGKVVK